MLGEPQLFKKIRIFEPTTLKSADSEYFILLWWSVGSLIDLMTTSHAKLTLKSPSLFNICYYNYFGFF